MKKLTIALFLICSLLQAKSQTKNLPFILQDESKLASFKQRYGAKDKEVIPVIDTLLIAADEVLKASLYSVTFQKTKTAPSGDIHDYVSQAPYWWPDSSKPDGKPYIRKDGRINPERNLSHDYGQMGRMNSDVKTLALAYYFTGNEGYAKKAISLLQVWFLDTATRMNPNLNFGQYIPGITDGRGIGIIETVGLTNIPDALAMMQKSKWLTAGFVAGIKQWFSQYAHWLMTSKNGKDEKSQTNNHGTYYDMQLADFALFTGDNDLAKKVIETQTIPRIDQQFTIDGAEPLELIRTKSWGYATMNLMGWCKLAVIADRINIDLWHQQTLDGKGMKKVFEWFRPYLLKEKKWNYEQIEPITYGAILTLYKLAAAHYPDEDFQKILALYPESKKPQAWW